VGIGDIADRPVICPRCRYKGKLSEFGLYIDFWLPVSMSSVFVLCPKAKREHRIPFHEMLEAGWISAEEADNLLASARVQVEQFVRESEQALRGGRGPMFRKARRNLRKTKKTHGIT